ncbi:MAG: methylmalonyl Co-A mutase-associated GTPase MeaB [Acidimicrobiales bacterium]
MTTAADYVDGVLAGDRTWIGRAITLVESTRADHRQLASEVLAGLVTHSGDAHRVGITGVPGVGKSTFIDALGSQLTGAGHRVAVLAVDPSSTVSGGSILGDKTRMARLSVDPAAFIRPSPAAGTLGGVTRTTRETMVVLEAAGHDVVLVETVGVGQSETVVASMVDMFCVLALPGAGDELQGIKKGVLELADMIAVNKADGPGVTAARQAVRDYRAALRLLRPTSPSWDPPVLACSALTGDGLDDFWETVERHRETLTGTGEFDERRRRQQLQWMWSMVEDRLVERLRADPAVAAVVARVEPGVMEGTKAASVAAEEILSAFAGDGAGGGVTGHGAAPGG